MIYAEKKFRILELSNLLASGDKPALTNWITELADEVDKDTKEIVIGATGGLRVALVDGTVSSETVESFEDELELEFGDRAHFQILSGDDEASGKFDGFNREGGVWWGLWLLRVLVFVGGGAGGGSISSRSITLVVPPFPFISGCCKN